MKARTVSCMFELDSLFFVAIPLNRIVDSHSLDTGVFSECGFNGSRIRGVLMWVSASAGVSFETPRASVGDFGNYPPTLFVKNRLPCPAFSRASQAAGSFVAS